MKINNKVLSIPPHISTSWNNIQALHMRGPLLVVSLKEGGVVEIPSLDAAVLTQIFQTHSSILEKPQINDIENILTLPMNSLNIPSQPLKIPLDIHLPFGGEAQSFLIHNANNAEFPDVPEDVLQKIVAITHILSPDGTANFPEPVENCNCLHCQLGRAMQEANRGIEAEMNLIVGDLKADSVIENAAAEEVVNDSELLFQDWIIEQSTPNIFLVINKQDPNERYSVCLQGDNVGCTCGQKGCEHLIAVLKS